MNTTTRKHTIAAMLSVIGALLILGETAQAATSKPAGMSNAEHRALLIRSEALNKKYHLGTYSTVPHGMTTAAHRALELRSEALNKKYHLGTYSTATAAGFSWSAFGIGAAAVVGLVLLASGTIAVGRHGWRTPRTRISS